MGVGSTSMVGGRGGGKLDSTLPLKGPVGTYIQETGRGQGMESYSGNSRGKGDSC